MALVFAETTLRIAAFALHRQRETPIGGDPKHSLIACFGDSFTYGFGVTSDQAYPGVLQQRLIDRNLPYRVSNMAYPGLSTTEMVWGVEHTLASKKPALVIVLGGWNANNADFASVADSRNAGIPLLTRLDTLADHSRLYRLAKHVSTSSRRTVRAGNKSITPQSPRMDLYNFRDYQQIARDNLRHIARLCREKNTPLLFLNYPSCDLPPNVYSPIEYYHVVFGRTQLFDRDYIVSDRRKNEIAIHSIIRSVGDEMNVPVIDMQEVFLRTGRRDLFQSDFHHPTASGYALMADAIANYLSARLKPLPDTAAARRALPKLVSRIPLDK